MNNRTVGVVVTVLSALCCLCAAIISCSFGVVGATGAPIDTTVNEQTIPVTMPPALGYALLCLSLLFVATPVVIGYFTLRQKPAPVLVDNEPLPPAS